MQKIISLKIKNKFLLLTIVYKILKNKYYLKYLKFNYIYFCLTNLKKKKNGSFKIKQIFSITY